MSGVGGKSHAMASPVPPKTEIKENRMLKSMALGNRCVKCNAAAAGIAMRQTTRIIPIILSNKTVTVAMASMRPNETPTVGKLSTFA